jgi:hypothetical protein
MLTFLFTFTCEFDTEQIVPTVSTLLELPVYPPPGVDLVSDENHRYGRPVHPVTYVLVNVRFIAPIYRVYQNRTKNEKLPSLRLSKRVPIHWGISLSASGTPGFGGLSSLTWVYTVSICGPAFQMLWLVFAPPGGGAPMETDHRLP